VKEIVGPFDNASLTKREKGQRKFMWMREMSNIGYRPVNPGIFLVGKINL
jgi:hypothetical protein